MERLTVDGSLYRLEINGKQVANEIESSYDVQFSKDIIKVKSIYKSDETIEVYRYEDAVIDCKKGIELAFKIGVVETDIVCHYGKCKIKKVSKLYPDKDATKFKIKLKVI